MGLYPTNSDYCHTKRYAAFMPRPDVFAARFGYEPVRLVDVPTGDLLTVLQTDRLNVRNVISVQAEIDRRRERMNWGTF